MPRRRGLPTSSSKSCHLQNACFSTILQPADEKRLAQWLEDTTARVILIDREFNFKGSEGTTTGRACRSKDRCGANNGGQDTIKDNCDANENPITATWDNAGRRGIRIRSNKSLVGVGDRGVIRGKGLRITGGDSNIIIQNIHFTVYNISVILPEGEREVDFLLRMSTRSLSGAAIFSASTVVTGSGSITTSSA